MPETNYGDLAMGAIFVLISSLARFKAPPTDRSSTTALRYYTAAFFYLLVAMGLYFGLLTFPAFVEALGRETGMFSGLAGEIAAFISKHRDGQISPAPLVALLLTVLLPRIPPLADAEAWVRKHLQAMGAIPHEARRLADELFDSRFSAPPRVQEEVSTRLANEGFHPDDVVFVEDASLEHLWTKISCLLVQLEAWENDRKFMGFLATFKPEFDDIKRRYGRLALKVRLLRATVREGAGGNRDRAVIQWQKELMEQSKEILIRIYRFTARGLLQCGTTYGARTGKLASLGFEIEPVKPTLTLDQLILVFCAIGSLLLSSFMFLSRFWPQPGTSPSQTPGIAETIERVTMIDIIYMMALVCAIFPKERWELARRIRGNVRPWTFYLIAGLLAAASSLAINLAFQGVVFNFSRLHGGLDLNALVGHFWLSSPWALCSFATAFMVAWMADDELSERLPKGRLRWVEGVGGACVLVLAAWIVVVQLLPQESTRLRHVAAGLADEVRGLNGQVEQLERQAKTLSQQSIANQEALRMNGAAAAKRLESQRLARRKGGLEEAVKAHGRANLAQALPLSGAIGFVIGFLIPTWCREKNRESARASGAQLTTKAGSAEAAVRGDEQPRLNGEPAAPSRRLSGAGPTMARSVALGGRGAGGRVERHRRDGSTGLGEHLLEIVAAEEPEELAFSDTEAR